MYSPSRLWQLAPTSIITVLMLVGASGCSHQQSDLPAPGSSSTAPTSPPSVSRPTSVRLGTADTTDGVGTSTSSYVYLPSSGRTQVVRSRADGKVVLRHRTPGAGWIVAHALFATHRVAFFDEDTDLSDNVKSPGRLTVYDVGSAQRPLAVRGVAGKTTVSTFPLQSGLSGEDIYYTSGAHGVPNCISRLDLRTLRASLIRCVPASHRVLFLRTGPAGVSWIETAGADFGTCRTGYLLRAPGTPTPLAGVPRCRAFDTGLMATTTLWSEVPEGDDFSAASLFAQVGGASRVDLGLMNSGSLRVCGDAAYWIATPKSGGRELHTWQPGGTAGQVVLAVSGDRGMAPIECADGTATVSVPDVATKTTEIVRLEG